MRLSTSLVETIRLVLPALIPSWRFFDTIAPSPRIEFALLENEQDVPGNWREFRPRPASLSILTLLKRIFWNPRWNETLFLVSCAERLMENPTDHSRREIVNRIRHELGPSPARYLQFRLAFISRDGAILQRRIDFVSHVYPLSETTSP